MKIAGRPGLYRDPVSHRWKRIIRKVTGVRRVRALPPVVAPAAPGPAGALAVLWARLKAAWDAFIARLIGWTSRWRETAPHIDDEVNARFIADATFHAHAFLGSLGVVAPARGGDFDKGVTEAVQRLGTVDMVGLAYGAGSEAARGAGGDMGPAELAVLNIVRGQVGARVRQVVQRVVDTLASRLAQADGLAAVQGMLGAAPLLAGDTPALLADLAGPDGAWMTEWTRTAQTELVRAFNFGHLAATLQAVPGNEGKAGPGFSLPDVKVFKLPASDEACAYCNRLWLLPDGTPRLYDLREILENGDNAVGDGGRPRRGGDLRATVGPVHPNCHCGPLRLVDADALSRWPGLVGQVAHER